jgi:acyl transferase domain-containing protein/NAD(P)H-dependent flavin oxidoreductase YrpB (nitropropane dioxygenase family)/NAD(P)-dependent dehydrogenase (short-subunit alcohol dehydrogenase family)
MTVSILVCTPAHRCDAQLAIAAARFGEIGILDLGYDDFPASAGRAVAELKLRLPAGSDRWGLRWDMLGSAKRSPAMLRQVVGDGTVPTLVLDGVPTDAETLENVLEAARSLARRVVLEVRSLAEALGAQEAGYDGVIVKGHEAGGWVGEESTFLLLQRLRNKLTIPYWARGGIGPDTAAATILSGAAGFVLGEQLWLTTESPFDSTEQRRWRQCDGSETVCVGSPTQGFRLCNRVGRTALAEVEKSAAAGGDWATALRNHLLAPNSAAADRPIALGQEIAFAGKLAEQFVSVAGVLRSFRQRLLDNPKQAIRDRALAADSPLAEAHGTLYPILQGPMTRVSDVAPFCEAVAAGGGLPFLALALMSGPEVRRLLEETSELLADRPWGVGILGFVPPQLRKEQLEVIAEVRPPYAIIAGGRPSQAQEMEQHGITTYLHVPSPGLLDAFIREGARRFILEGRECGGHVGPRSSFVLWQSAIDVILASGVPGNEFHVVFAGGIHDALSAALVAAIAAPLTAKGVKVGILMGTAYLFTHEAVSTGAITAEFQRQAIECQETVLLESGVGHATRAARSPFADEFLRTKQELLRAGTSHDEVRVRLEMLNVGRLRIAAKGVTRSAATGDLGTKGELKRVGEVDQRRDGLYMIGQLATLRDEALPLEQLHAEVCQESGQLLDKLCTASPAKPLQVKRAAGEPIALVGMSCLFAGADDVRSYWQNICNKIDSVGEVPADRWRIEDYFSEDRLARDKVYSRWGGFVGKFIFDPLKWKIPPASLASIEPVQLLSLEVAHRALIDAGYDRRDFPRDRTGVLFAVAGSHDLGTAYCVRTMLRHYLSKLDGASREMREQLMGQLEEVLPEWTEDTFPGFLANVVAGRIARELNLGGPNYVVDAACAASLAALHAGIEQLRTHAADMVLVGGADLTNNAFCYMSFAKTYALSPRGRSRPFDDSADGIGLGEGVATVVLKRLADAERDGDRIYAVIKGIGASGDGRNRTLTAPSPRGQALALERAYDDADVPPPTIDLIEAHGTGTPVGDSSELTSLHTLYSRYPASHASTAVGSVKSMIGHTKTVAGLAGLIKTALALKHAVLPATIGVEKPTTRFDFSQGPFYINTETRPWIREDAEHPRRAGVSAFGFGGTNFHVVMEEYTGGFHPGLDLDLMPRPVEVFLFRRDSREEVVAALKTLRAGLEGVGPGALAELAAALAAEETGAAAARKARLGIVAATIEELGQKIDKAIALLGKQAAINDPSGIYYGEGAPAAPGSVCFLYPGQGSQQIGMLGDLVRCSPWAHEWFTRVNAAVAEHLPVPLSRTIYPVPAFDDATRQKQKQALEDTRVAQPALGVVEVFATELLRRYGIEPGLLAGHSYGELTALWAAGSLDGEDLLRLSALRGRFCAGVTKTVPGGMVAVAAGAEATQAALKEFKIPAELANLNAPDQTIIAGPEAVLAAVLEKFPRKGLRVQRIPVSAPFHSSALQLASEAFAAVLTQFSLRQPRLPVYSNTTAERHSDDPAVIAATVVRQLHEPVRFEQEVRRLHADGARVFLEVGPGKVLSDLVKRILGDESVVTLPLSAPGRDGWTQFAHLLTRGTALGLPVRLAPWFHGRRLRTGTAAEVLTRARTEGKPRPTDWIITAGQAEPVTPLPGKGRKPAQPAAATPTPAAAPATPPAAAPLTNGHIVAPAPAAAPKAPAVIAATAAPLRQPAPVRLAVPAPKAAPRPAATATGTELPRPTDVSSPVTQGISGSMITHAHETLTNGTPHAALTGPEMFAQFQATTRELFSLQTAQQQVVERYLATQERLLLACLQGAPVAIPAPLPAAVERAVAAAAVAPAVVAAPAALRPAAVPVVRPAVPVPANGSTAKAPPRVVAAPAVAPSRPKAPVAVPTAPAAVEAAPALPPTVNGHPPAAHAAAPESAPPPTEAFRRDLLQIVSERTGYPIEMLDETLPLEAGLGIDSIKTVEIFSKLKDYHIHFQEMAKGQSEEELLAAFTKLKTLKDVVANYDNNRKMYLDRASGRPAAPEKAASPIPEAQEVLPEAMKLVSRVTRSTPQDVKADNTVERHVLRAVSVPEGPDATEAPVGRYSVVILGDGDELTEALKAAAAKLENAPLVFQIIPGSKARQLGGNRYEADLSSPESIRQARSLLMGPGDLRVGGVLNCLSLTEPFRSWAGEDNDTPLTASTWLLNVVKEFVEDLSASVADGGGWFVNLTPLGGKFGLEAPADSGPLPIATVGSIGIAKALSREYSKLRVRNVDIDPNLPANVLVPRLLREGAMHGPVIVDPTRRLPEVGLSGEGRCRLELQKESLPADLEPLPITPESVVLVVGGAQGVTASVSKAVAATGCKVIIAGLSPMPPVEPADLAGLERPELRQKLIARAQAAGESVLPADVERQCNRILKDRQIRATLKACEAAGGQVEYHTMDARDEVKFAAFLDELYERHGRIDGVIHGAGVIEDKLLPDKTVASFAKVFQTKVSSALTLARKLRPEQLKFVVFFSSVAARFGNPGQADYAAANEFLNKLASDLERRWPGRVVSVMWGPWDGGMVSEPTRDLRASYAQVGIGLIPIPEGAAACLAELRLATGRPSEVLISTSVARMIEMSNQR